MNIELDWSVIGKYDKAGPRYTSYPTAPVFSTEVAGDDLVEELQRTRASKVPLSLYVHLPFCRELCWYCGCNMKVSRNQEQMQSHFDLIGLEIERMAGEIAPDRTTCQIHLGGGSPNYLDNQQLSELMFSMRRLFPVCPDAEVSIEIDPRLVTEAQVQMLKICGFNRVSMGVQDFNPEVQKAIHRRQPHERVSEVVDQIRGSGIPSLNMDLIYGLPKQTQESFAKTVAQTIALNPDRIALFNFAWLPNFKPHMKLIKGEDLPEPKQKLIILRNTVAALCEAGYVYIGMDHFARPEDPLSQAQANGDLHRNFQGYTTHASSEMLGFGMSAISMLDSLYVQNRSVIPDYEACIRNGASPAWRGYRLTEDDRFRRHIINRLMCRYTVEPAYIGAMAGADFDQIFPGVRVSLDEMCDDGLLTWDGRCWTATLLGRLLLRNVAMLFDSYLADLTKSGKTRFSRTV